MTIAPLSRTGLPTLPRKKEVLAQLLHDHVKDQRSVMQANWARWQLSLWYLQGYREFALVDKEGNAYKPMTVKERRGSTRKALELGEMVKQINEAQGVIASMDMRPYIERNDMSLASLRERAAARILIGSAINEENLARSKTLHAHFVSVFGTAGLQQHTYQSNNGLRTDYEVIHPSQLVPFPATGWDLGNVRGVIRTRAMPLDEVRKRYPGKVPRENLGDLEVYDRKIGDAPPDNLVSPEHQPIMRRTSQTRGTAMGTEDVVKYVIVNETYIETPDGNLARMIVSSYRTILYDQEFEGQQITCPIAVTRFYENGSFWGTGLFDVLFSSVREMEGLLEYFADAVREQDQYQALAVPQGTINTANAFVNNGRGMKVLKVAAETGLLGERPFTPVVIPTNNVMGIAQQASEIFAGVTDRQSPIRDLLREKGRVDSAAGLQFLQEQDRQSLFTPLQNTARSYSQTHRSALEFLSVGAYLTNDPIPVNRLTLDLVGAVINVEQGTISFSENPIPNVSRLQVKVREETVRSEAIRKQEALQLFEMHGDLQRFIRFALEEGLDFAMHMGDQRAAYEMGVLNIITLYGDGLYPQAVEVNPHFDRPAIQLPILDEFMASPAMRAASSEVKDAFINYRKQLQRFANVFIPEQLPDPYEIDMNDIQRMLLQNPEQGGQPQTAPQMSQ